MTGRRSRVKGAAGEREFFELSNKLVEDIDWPFRDKSGKIFMRHPSPRAGHGQQDNHDPFGTLPLSIEVKRVERLSIPQWIEQAERQARPEQVPIVAYRQNGEPWRVLAVMDSAEWNKYLHWKLGGNHATTD